MSTEPRRAVTPTQVTHPWRATARTIVQAIIGAILGLGVVAPATAAIIGEELGQWLPDGWLAALVAAAALIAAVSGALARIMSIPQVNRWLSHLGLDAGDDSDS